MIVLEILDVGPERLLLRSIRIQGPARMPGSHTTEILNVCPNEDTGRQDKIFHRILEELL